MTPADNDPVPSADNTTASRPTPDRDPVPATIAATTATLGGYEPTYPAGTRSSWAQVWKDLRVPTTPPSQTPSGFPPDSWPQSPGQVTRNLTALFPALPALVRAEQEFRAHAVHCCVDRGIDQVIDLGAGYPDLDAWWGLPMRVVSVDVDPLVTMVTNADVSRHQRTNQHAAVTSDFRAVSYTLQQVEQTGLIDLSRPVALIATSVLHHARDHAITAMQTYTRALAPGSVVIATHLTLDSTSPATQDRLGQFTDYIHSVMDHDLFFRCRYDLAELAAGHRMLPPSISWLSDWAPDRPAHSGDLEATIPGDNSTYCLATVSEIPDPLVHPADWMCVPCDGKGSRHKGNPSAYGLAHLRCRHCHGYGYEPTLTDSTDSTDSTVKPASDTATTQHSAGNS